MIQGSYNQALPHGSWLVSRALPGLASRALCSNRRAHLPSAGTVLARAFLKKSTFVYSILLYSIFIYFILFFSVLARCGPAAHPGLALARPGSAICQIAPIPVLRDRATRDQRQISPTSPGTAPDAIYENSIFTNVWRRGRYTRKLNLLPNITESHLRGPRKLNLYQCMARGRYTRNLDLYQYYGASPGEVREKLNLSQCFGADSMFWS